jgi:ParB/RepB/Spo0J family partition protein
MSKDKNIKTAPIRSRVNVADSIDATAKRIAASLSKHQESDEWDQERIEKLKSCDGKVGEIPISMIRTNQNIRKSIDETDASFKELVESIHAHGILQPPIVTVVTNDNGISSILLVGGERRLRAALAAGHTSINCLVRIFNNPTTRLTASMAENMNRLDLDCLDIAHCFLSLSDQGYKYSEIEKLFSRDEKTIGRYIKMARWPKSTQELIRQNSDKLNTRYLLALASRKLSDADVTTEIERKINGTSSSGDSNTKRNKEIFMSKFAQYCESKKLDKKDKDLIFTALVELGVVSSEGVPTSIRPVRGASASSKQEVECSH